MDKLDANIKLAKKLARDKDDIEQQIGRLEEELSKDQREEIARLRKQVRKGQIAVFKSHATIVPASRDLLGAIRQLSESIAAHGLACAKA